MVGIVNYIEGRRRVTYMGVTHSVICNLDGKYDWCYNGEDLVHQEDPELIKLCLEECGKCKSLIEMKERPRKIK